MRKSATGKAATKPNPPQVLAFEVRADWRDWLDKNFQRTEGIWLRFFKKDSGVVSIRYSEALDEALCYGWIDGQVKKLDAKSYLQNSRHAERAVFGQNAMSSM